MVNQAQQKLVKMLLIFSHDECNDPQPLVPYQLECHDLRLLFYQIYPNHQRHIKKNH